jgi:hypothetical protein
MTDQKKPGGTTAAGDLDGIDRRRFMTGAVGAAAGLAAAATAVRAAEPMVGAPPGAGLGPPPGANAPRLFRVEMDITDCEVEGKIPMDLAGGFYRTGPDAQYPLAKGNIPFDGEGHVSLFRFNNGNVDYKSRFVRNERYVAQEKAGQDPVPDVPQSLPRRPVGEGPEPRHAQHAHHPWHNACCLR